MVVTRDAKIHFFRYRYRYLRFIIWWYQSDTNPNSTELHKLCAIGKRHQGCNDNHLPIPVTIANTSTTNKNAKNWETGFIFFSAGFNKWWWIKNKIEEKVKFQMEKLIFSLKLLLFPHFKYRFMLSVNFNWYQYST